MNSRLQSLVLFLLLIAISSVVSAQPAACPTAAPKPSICHDLLAASAGRLSVQQHQPNGAPPITWNNDEMNPCPNAPTEAFVLASFSKFGNLGQASVGSLVGPLVSQNASTQG